MKHTAKRWLGALLAGALILGNLPVPALAQESDGLCDHHPQHTEQCGYRPASQGHGCSHEHTDECYEAVTQCIHVHDGCGYVAPVEGHGCDCQPDESGEIVHIEGCGYVQAAEEVPCGHACSEESGCVSRVLKCPHVHDSDCGYEAAAEEVPCAYDCTECKADPKDPDNPEDPEDPGDPPGADDPQEEESDEEDPADDTDDADDPESVPVPFDLDTTPVPVDGDPGDSNMTNVVVFVSFSDTEHAAECHTASLSHCIQDSDGADLIRGYFDYRPDGSKRSLKEYLRTVSNGRCRVYNVFSQISDAGVADLRLSFPASEFQNFTDDSVILTKVQDYLKSTICSGAVKLDHNTPGYIDNVTVVLCGNVPNFRSHASFFPGDYDTDNGNGVGNYTMVEERDILTYLGGAGVVTHELMHHLGFTDLYRDGAQPVGRWDIMSSASDFMLYPLAWQRFSAAGWLTEANLQTVTEDGTYTIYAPTKDTNHSQKQALVLKTPYSDAEFFVVEYRISEVQDYVNYAIDYKIPSTGLVIYRVNTGVSDRKNTTAAGTPYYIYAFRDGSGMGGDTEEPKKGLESGESFGSDDPAATAADGAITYNDNTNSGIIVQAGTVGGDSVAVTVTFSGSFSDSWNTVLGDLDAATGTSMGSCRDDSGNVYQIVGSGSNSLVFRNGSGLGTIPDYPLNYDGCGAAVLGDSLCLLRADYTRNQAEFLQVPLSDVGSKAFTYTVPAASVTYPGAVSSSGGVYFAFIHDNVNIRSFFYDGTAVKALPTKSLDFMAGSLKLVSAGADAYLVYRSAADNTIYLDKLSASGITALGSFRPSDGVNGLDALYSGGKLILAVGGTQSTSTVYAVDPGNPGQPETVVSLDKPASEISIVQSGDAYYLTGLWQKDGTTLQTYRIQDGTASPLSNPLSNDIVSFLASYPAGNTLQTVYLQNSKPFLKQLTIAAAHTHTPVSAGNAVAATCTKAGYSGDTKCSGCGQILSYGNPISMTPHSWGDYVSNHDATETSDGTKTAKCRNCTATNTVPDVGSKLPVKTLTVPVAKPQSVGMVCVDGAPVSFTAAAGGVSIPIPAGSAKIVTTYTMNNNAATDVHTQYPTGMQVYRLRQTGGSTTAERIAELDNLLQYSGSSIRIVGNKGIRMITSINQDTRNQLTGGGLAGYRLLEYGTLLAQTSKLGKDPLVLGGKNVKSNYAYKKDVADPVFMYTNGLIQYTNVLVGFNMEQCKEDIAMRPYIKLADSAGQEVVIYGGIVYRSIGYIAWQNRNVFSSGTAAYNYVWDIIHAVYGNDYKG